MIPRQLNELKYLDLVVKESLRLHPPVPFVARKCPEDMVIGGKFFPEGSDISLGFFMLCHDERYFKDPEKFNPDRFDPSKTKEKLNPFVYTPFAAGPRNCIGKTFRTFKLHKNLIIQLFRTKVCTI